MAGANCASAQMIISITNSSFESPANSADTLVNTTPTDYQSFALGGGLDFIGNGATLAGSGISGPHSGSQYYLAYDTGAGAGGARALNQDTSLLWSSLSAGDLLSLSVWTTYRNDLPSGSFVMWLNDVDGSGINSLPVNIANDSLPGAWTQRVWNHTVTQGNLDAAAAGSWDAVNIQFGMLGGGVGSDPQMAFDDVSFQVTPVPEPSTWALLALGSLSLMLYRWRAAA
jgi:hypothetical protein